ncbi:MAG: hypothetical protein CMP11_00480 [Zetaproteobacteria bacterium]|nr:hypothetical protein [Pseudobdellovibrionaceae bacterium]|tara:strand:+ start:368 stop:757 length:390 start_codon:yes stop_codon:yes gene_type:complete
MGLFIGFMKRPVASTEENFKIRPLKRNKILEELSIMSEEKELTIEAARRSETGKSYNRKLRAKGLIPGNIYKEEKSEMIELDPKWLSKAWKNGKKFNLSIDGQIKPVVIKELQINPVKRSAVHVDVMYL